MAVEADFWFEPLIRTLTVQKFSVLFFFFYNVLLFGYLHNKYVLFFSMFN
ncbi:hypothetical protein QF042_001976 [Pedobacter sp. W3I1]|nr:hypothetical protein [Pedobacter sp. W3I1]